MARTLSSFPRHHDTVTMPVPGHVGGVRVVITADGVLQSLVDYFAHVGARSPSWQRKVAAAVGLLFDYHIAAPPETPRDREQFLAQFASRLRHGTIEPDGSDPRDLWWQPAPRTKVREVLASVTAFTDWCAMRFDAPPLNPLRPATFPERMAAYRALDRRSALSLLRHLESADRLWAATASVRAVRPEPQHRVAERRPPFFPFERTRDLLGIGFSRRAEGAEWERYNIRDLMIALLQRFGGLRASEAFHLFVGDVTPVIADPAAGRDGTSARVTLYHPADGSVRYRDPATRQVELVDRARYLREVYGRVPRNDPRSSLGEYAGWKELLLEVGKPHNCAFVHWFPEEWGTVFWRLYDLYTRHVMPSGLDHPYLFVNLAGDAGAYGAPYRLESYHGALDRAVRRLGLRSAKPLGTTSHGLRHAYGQTLSKLQVPRKLIQVFMHHKSPASQDAYTLPEAKDADAALKLAYARLMDRGATLDALRADLLPAGLVGAGS